MTAAAYINPLPHITQWGRTDQGVDFNLPVGAPILAPGKVKIIGTIPNWYNGQPYVWWQLLDGPDAGKYQYVGEQISNIAGGGKPGTIVQAGQPIARYAASGTGIEYGWAAASGQTLAQATPGYSGDQSPQALAAGNSIRSWLHNVATGKPSGGGGGIIDSVGGAIGNIPGDIAGGVGSVISGGANAVGGAIGGAVQSAVSSVFSGFLSWAEQGLEKGALYAALILGGIALAGYGLVKTLEPTGIPQTVAQGAGAKTAAEGGMVE